MANTVAIMQPYAFPNLGYFCLAQASDRFVFYDDVNFIKRGWINRNRILINGAEYKFSIPLANASQNELICDIQTHQYPEFRARFLKQLGHAYSKAAHFSSGLNYVEQVLQPDTESIAELAIRSVELFAQLTDIRVEFLRSSEHCAESRGLAKADRLIAITQSLGSSDYVNAMGGAELYDKAYFLERGVQLSFVQPSLQEYAQTGVQQFVAGLSVIDVLMHNEIAAVKEMLQQYERV